MQVLVVKAPRQIEIQHRPDLPLGPNMVRVQPHYFGISAGTELNTYRGGVNWHTGRDEATGLFFPDTEHAHWSYPAEVGYANVGEVVELSPDVSSLKLGQTVCSTFAHTLPLTGPAHRFMPTQAGIDPKKYLFFQLVRTAVNVVHHARSAFGDTLVIFGLGPVGLITLQLARRAGAARIIGFDPLAARRKLALQLGADFAADPTQDEAAAFVRQHNQGRGADVAIECAATGRALQDATRAVDRRGRVILASMPQQAFHFHFGQEVHFNAVSIAGANVMQPPHDLGPLWSLRRQEQLALDLIPALDLLPLITHEFPFARAADAYALIDRQGAEVVSVILRCDPASSEACLTGSARAEGVR